MNNVPEYTRRMDALHAALVDALRPETDHERSTLRWLRDTMSPDGLAALCEMIERAVSKATSEAYERGRGEGIETAAEWQARGLDPEMWPEQPGDQRRAGR